MNMPSEEWFQNQAVWETPLVGVAKEFIGPEGIPTPGDASVTTLGYLRAEVAERGGLVNPVMVVQPVDLTEWADLPADTPMQVVFVCGGPAVRGLEGMDARNTELVNEVRSRTYTAFDLPYADEIDRPQGATDGEMRQA